MPVDAYRKALQFLSRRPHFESELQLKLGQRDYDDEEIAETLDRLRRDRLLDDVEAARVFVRSKLRRSPMGRRRLRAELVRRGALDSAIDEALNDPDLPAESDLLAAALERHQRRGGHEQGALLRHLDRQGFSRSDILRVLDDASASDPSP